MMKTIIALWFCLVAGVGCRFGQVQWVHAQYPRGVEFIGMRKNESAPTTYFSVRAKGTNRQPIPADCWLTLHWQGKSLRVADISASNLVAAGIQPRPQDYKGPEAEFAFIGGADDQNRDYGIEFHLESKHIIEFYARHNWRSAIPCPFELSGSNGDRIRFPFGETELKKYFGEPESITGVWGY